MNRRRSTLRRALPGLLALSLGLAPRGAAADELEWRAAAPDKTPAAAPIAAPEPAPAVAEPGDLAWTAVRPVVRGQKPTTLPDLPTPGPKPAPAATATKPAPAAPKPAFEPVPLPGEHVVPVEGEVIGGPVLAAGKHARFGSPEITIARDYDLGLYNPPTTSDFPYRFSVRGEYLMWWVKPDRVPVLATTSDPNAGIGGDAPNGILGRPSTQVVYGGNELDHDTRHGARFTVNYWDDCTDCGVQAGFFFLGEQNNCDRFDSTQFPVLARPIFAPNVNPLTGRVIGEFSELVAAPGLGTGSIEICNSSDVHGADLNFTKLLCSNCDERREVYFGPRYMNLSENISITENIVAGPLAAQQDPPIIPGTAIIVRDEFRTTNRFYGGQIGGRYERRLGRVSLEARGSLALGITEQTVEINGALTQSPPGMMSRQFVGGLLTAPSNIGSRSQGVFSVIPEMNLNLGYQVTDHLRIYGGYSFLWWSNVVRPGTEIDRVVDITQVPVFAPTGQAISAGRTRPAVQFDQTDFWMHGLNFGLEVRW